MTDSELQQQLARYKFYHTIRLTETISTPGVPNFLPLTQPILRTLAKVDFAGRRVLDIGCRDGLYCFESEKRGAARVLGIDNCLSLGAVELLIPFLQSKVEMRELGLFELTKEEHGEFDIILFLGVLYHLRYPFLAFKTLAQLLPEGGRMIVETGIFADDEKRALLFCPVGAESPYEASSVTFYNRKGLTDTLRSFGLRVDATDYVQEADRKRKDGTVIRGTFLCTKDSSLADPALASYWAGGTHKNWQLKS